MEGKAVVLALVLLAHACVPLLADASPPEEAPGLLQRILTRAREVKEKVQGAGSTALGFLGAYYEDHVQPLADSITQRASTIKDSIWKKEETRVNQPVIKPPGGGNRTVSLEVTGGNMTIVI